MEKEARQLNTTLNPTRPRIIHFISSPSWKGKKKESTNGSNSMECERVLSLISSTFFPRKFSAALFCFPRSWLAGTRAITLAHASIALDM
jgi:hypothetical protein